MKGNPPKKNGELQLQYRTYPTRSNRWLMSASLIGRLSQALSGYPPLSVDVARGLALLFGLGTKALPSWDSRIRRNNLYRGLAVRYGRPKRTYELTSSIVPRGTAFHR